MMGKKVYRSRLEFIPVSRLVADPMNPKKDIGDVYPLVKDIRKRGFLSPLTVRPLRDGKYGVISGLRRLEAARIADLQEVPCLVVDNLPDEEVVKWAYEEEKTHILFTADDVYNALEKLKNHLGSWRQAAKALNIPWSTAYSLIERIGAKRTLKELGLEEIDARNKRAKSSEATMKGVKKTTAKKLHQAQKLLLKIVEKRGEENGLTDGKSKECVKKFLENPLEAAEQLEWKPKRFKADEKGPYLHQQLKRPETILSIPKSPTKIELHQLPNSIAPAMFPIARLNAPFDNIRILLCPNCLNPLRGLGHGSPIACLECGFPNQDKWKPV